MALKDNKEISVCVVEKGVEVGAHILSGNVFETTALDELFPDWTSDPDAPLKTKAGEDSFKILTGEKGYFSVPNFLKLSSPAFVLRGESGSDVQSGKSSSREIGRAHV